MHNVSIAVPIRCHSNELELKSMTISPRFSLNNKSESIKSSRQPYLIRTFQSRYVDAMWHKATGNDSSKCFTFVGHMCQYWVSNSEYSLTRVSKPLIEMKSSLFICFMLEPHGIKTFLSSSINPCWMAVFSAFSPSLGSGSKSEGTCTWK